MSQGPSTGYLPSSPATSLFDSSSLSAIVNLIASTCLFVVVAFILRRFPTQKIFYFFLVALILNIVGSLVDLCVSNNKIAFIVSNSCASLALSCFILAIVWLVREWIFMYAPTLSPATVRFNRGITMANYVAVPIATVLMISNIIFYSIMATKEENYVLVAVIIYIFVAIVLLVQALTLYSTYRREGRNMQIMPKKQLKFLGLFTLLQCLSTLFTGLAYWQPVLGSVASWISFLWLVLVLWPGALQGYGRKSEEPFGRQHVES